MNLSPDNIVANGGSGLDDRPDYTDTALEMDRRVGWREGKPVVPNPDGDSLKLGDDPGEAYSHYVRGEQLLLPSAGDFLRQLFESDLIASIDDVAEELNTDRSQVRQAAELHGLETPSNDGSDTDGDSDDKQLRLPSGETVPFDPLSPLVVGQLLSDGMSYEEAARYLSRETGSSITAADIREVADSLSGDGSDRVESRVPRGKTQSGSEGYQSTPW